MEAVRLKLPLETLRLIREYSSDRVGVHPTAKVCGTDVDRWLGRRLLRWRYKVADGRTLEMNWLKDEDGWCPESIYYRLDGYHH